MDALQQLPPSSGRFITCAVVGDGFDLPNLKDYAKRLKDTVEISFTGRLDPPQVAAWMRRSRVLAFPTTSDWIEASPLTTLEAVASGCRVVATDNGGTKENIGPSGVLIQRDSLNALIVGLLKAMEEEPLTAHHFHLEFLQKRNLPGVIAHYIKTFAHVANSRP